MNIVKLQENVHNYLQDKRYVLVLDDIWDNILWEEVRHALPLRVRGRIILTTRNMNVASPIGKTCYIHQLQPLYCELAWYLFSRKAFRNSNPPGHCPHHLKQTAKAIMEECGGLPLAIVAIGGLMSKMEPLS
ncbi:hypothetical protein GIB67_029851 [Kingdonia uniflora]|uniref:NB-ARC domain-containing protein n=1 Tax=Kingdonia uniflora TaxID=39325 RepID=A0A7J7NJD7_9MAGN|nr:hypothetical protein GIB67_029851 [Kingdonia uniflora]